jgi:hypothetical protein
VFFEEGRFMPSGSIHLDCRKDYFESHEVLAPLLHFSPDLSDDDRAKLSRLTSACPIRNNSFALLRAAPDSAALTSWCRAPSSSA